MYVTLFYTPKDASVKIMTRMKGSGYGGSSETRTTSIAQGIQGALLSGRGQDGVRSSQLDNMKRAFQGGERSGQSSKNSQSVKELRISLIIPPLFGGFCRWGGGVEPQ